MRLRTLAGAYAGQIREYSAVAGMAALRTGMAARVEDPDRPVQAPPPVGAETNVTRIAEPASRRSRRSH